MNKNGLVIDRLDLDTILILSFTKAMALVGFSMDPMMGLDFDCVTWIGLVLWTS